MSLKEDIYDMVTQARWLYEQIPDNLTDIKNSTKSNDTMRLHHQALWALSGQKLLCEMIEKVFGVDSALLDNPIHMIRS